MIRNRIVTYCTFVNFISILCAIATLHGMCAGNSKVTPNGNPESRPKEGSQRKSFTRQCPVPRDTNLPKVAKEETFSACQNSPTIEWHSTLKSYLAAAPVVSHHRPRIMARNSECS